METQRTTHFDFFFIVILKLTSEMAFTMLVELEIENWDDQVLCSQIHTKRLSHRLALLKGGHVHQTTAIIMELPWLHIKKYIAFKTLYYCVGQKKDTL